MAVTSTEMTGLRWVNSIGHCSCAGKAEASRLDSRYGGVNGFGT
jgi:hypothetical protein